jgi:hypothetical protein
MVAQAGAIAVYAASGMTPMASVLPVAATRGRVRARTRRGSGQPADHARAAAPGAPPLTRDFTIQAAYGLLYVVLGRRLDHLGGTSGKPWCLHLCHLWAAVFHTAMIVTTHLASLRGKELSLPMSPAGGALVLASTASGSARRSAAGAAGRPSPETRSSPPERTGLRSPLGTDGPLSGGQPEVLLIRGKARPHRVRPADALKPGRDLGVIQVRVIAAFVADEFKRPGVAACYRALHDVGRLAPQARRAAVAGLAS